MQTSPILNQLPSPAPKRIALRISPAAERAIRQGHPWLFDESIQHQSHEGAPGDLAVVFDNQRDFLAIGLYDPTSPIRVRILQRGQPAAINGAWFATKIGEAFQRRAALRDASPPTNGYRLVYGENDGLPGLVIDLYANTAVIKLYTPAWIAHLGDVCAALTKIIPVEQMILRLSRSLAAQKEYLCGLEDGLPLGLNAPRLPILFQENGLTFESDPIQGQKTGFFLDQRENRARVEKLAAGRDVLNVFAYTGGFSVYAARGGARRVVSIDLSRAALDAAERNWAHNAHIPAVAAAWHEVIAGDAFEILGEMAKGGRSFDLVMLDPPMFAQNSVQMNSALRAYGRLTRLGLGVLRPGGILVQASCSSRVADEAFFDLVHGTAIQMGRPLEEIERTGHAVDHPVGFKEGAYLKCLFGRG